MSLINCPECTSEISDKAPACPKCGAPISAEKIATESDLVTTQETSKKLKMHILISVLLIFGGTIIALATAQSGGAGFGTLIAVVGLVWFITTRFRTWWHHK